MAYRGPSTMTGDLKDGNQIGAKTAPGICGGIGFYVLRGRG